MTIRRHLSLRQSLLLSMLLTVSSTVLGAGGLYGWQLYRGQRAAQRVRVQAFAETYAAQVAPTILQSPRADTAAMINQLAWHPDLCLLAVLDDQGRSIEVRGNGPLLKRYLTAFTDAAPPESATTFVIPAGEDGVMPELNLAAVPITPAGGTKPIGTLICAARAGGGVVGLGDAWQYFAGLLLLGATGLILGICALRLGVVAPLMQLARRCRTDGSNAEQEELPVDRQDELGELARVLARMNTDVSEWRGRAFRIERTVSQRVAAETQRITSELRRAEKKVWTDPLTGLGNRRCLEERFPQIFQAQCQARQDLAISMIDVDNFKTLNDRLGHTAGDDLLEFIGELLKQCLRDQDLAIRYGGDEFVLIFPGVSATEAETITDRTIKLFAQRARLLSVSPKPTMSAGVCSLLQHHPGSSEAMLEMADKALYAAKRSGKSQVAVSVDGDAEAGNRGTALTATR